MKKNIWKYALLLIGMLIAVPTVINAKDDKKAKKEKKQFEWTWDKKLSGNEDMDSYLLAVDSIWYQMQDLSSLVDTYSFKEDTMCIDGKYYIAAYAVNPEGNFVTRGTLNWQFAETTMLSANIVLKATTVGLQTVTASTALLNMGMKGFSYAKYIKAGPKVIELATVGVKDVWTKTKTQSKRWSAMKKAAVDPASIGLELTDAQKDVFNKCMYIIEITDASEEYEAVRNRYVDKTPEEIKQEQDAQLQNLTSKTVVPEDKGKSLEIENIDVDSELDKL